MQDLLYWHMHGTCVCALVASVPVVLVRGRFACYTC